MAPPGALNAFGSVQLRHTPWKQVEMVVSQPFVALGVTMATFCGQNLEQEDLTGLKRRPRRNAFVLCACMLAVACMVFKDILRPAIYGKSKRRNCGAGPAVFKYNLCFLCNTGAFVIIQKRYAGHGICAFAYFGRCGELTARFVVSIISFREL